MRKLKKIVEVTTYDGQSYTLFEYDPSLFRPLYGHLHSIHFVRRIRFFLEYLHRQHYKVFYLQTNDVIVGYCVVAIGGRRLKCSTNRDIVLGPYYICDENRGKGYSKILLSLTLKHCTYQYDYAYDWIHQDNLASIRASEAVGFKPCGRLSVEGMMRKLVVSDGGDNIIYRYQH